MTNLLTHKDIATFTLSKDKTRLTVVEDGEATVLDIEQAIELSVVLGTMARDLKRLANRMEQ
jgi:hypothetical protein